MVDRKMKQYVAFVVTSIEQVSYHPSNRGFLSSCDIISSWLTIVSLTASQPNLEQCDDFTFLLYQDLCID